MASSDVDQKYLGRLALVVEHTNPIVSDGLYQILGLSVLLARKLYRARKLRRLDTTRDTRSLQLYHHIIWLSREGRQILERYVLPYTQAGQEGSEVQVLAAKLRASFLHIFCLFNNNPPVTAASAVPFGKDAGPPSPRAEYYSGSGYESVTPQKEATPPKRNSRGKQPSLRDPINSVTSDASFLTNPYAGVPPGSSPPLAYETPSAPPGLENMIPPPNPSAFILPSTDFVPVARSYFAAASSAAAALLPGAHPLRLSTAIEYAAFMWDCAHDHEAARRLARQAIRQLREREELEASEEELVDAMEMVGVLGRIMKRRSFDSTPRPGQQQISGESSSGGPSGMQSFAGQHPAFQQQQQPVADAERTPTMGARGKRPAESSAPSSSARQGGRTRADSIGGTRPKPASTRSHQNSDVVIASASSSAQKRPANPPGIEGGPVGGVTPPPGPAPKRRESVKSAGSSGHRRGPSVHQATPTGGLSRSTSRRRTDDHGAIPVRYGPETPPRPPPKDAAYTPGSSGRRNGSRRASSSGGRRVEFANGHRRDEEATQAYVNGNGYYGHGIDPYSSGDGAASAAMVPAAPADGHGHGHGRHHRATASVAASDAGGGRER
jgi:hypothetical protein